MLRDAARAIHGHLDTAEVLETAAREMHALARAPVSVWMTAGVGEPRFALAYPVGSVSSDAPSPVVRCASSRKPVLDEDVSGFAAPVVAPRSGLVAVICVHAAPTASVASMVATLAADTAVALETAHLFEKAVSEKEKSEAILARVGDAVVVTDPLGRIVQWNPASEIILGTGEKQATGGTCAGVLGLHAGERALDCTTGCALLRARAEDATSGVEVWRPGGGSKRQPLLANVSAVRDADGNVAEVVHSFRDITRLKEADEAKTMFLATASHELKTPLTVIQGFAQALQTETWGDGADRATALDAMSRRARELNKIVDRLLLSSRIEAGRVDINTSDVDVVSIAQDRSTALALATGRAIVVEAPDVAMVQGDADALVTVVDHLLDNALKYSPEGGDVTIRCAIEGDAVSVSVVDHGIGMDADTVQRCFEKFWQAESSDSRRFGGTGIGLFIVRSLIEAMGGTATVTSARGAGSAFTVTLRRPGSEVQPVESPAAKPGDDVQPPSRPEPSVIREFMRQIGVPTRVGLL